MKRERVRIDDGWSEYGSRRTRPKKSRTPRAFVYKPRKAISTSQPRAIMDALEPADRVFAAIMEEIRIAAAAERAGWAKLNRYLATGTAPARPRIRV